MAMMLTMRLATLELGDVMLFPTGQHPMTFLVPGTFVAVSLNASLLLNDIGPIPAGYRCQLRATLLCTITANFKQSWK